MKKLVITGFSALIISCAGPAEKEEDLSEKVDSLIRETEELKRANDTLSEHLFQKTYLTRKYPPYFDTIAEPEEHLLENLRERKDLIPKDPVLGGTMRFTKVRFVDDELFVAEYEDGHIMGKAVYTYTVNNSGDLSFEIVGTIM